MFDRGSAAPPRHVSASTHRAWPPRRVASVALIMLCQSTQSLVLGGIALFLPLIRSSLGLDFAQAGLISAVSILTYSLMQLPSGYLADRIGPKRLFVVGLLGTNVLAFSFAHLHSYSFVLANQAASGFFRALMFAPGLLLIGHLFPPDRRATALGLYVAAGLSSNVFLNVVGPVIVKPLGWRSVFSIFSLAGLGVVALYWRFAPEAPAGAQGGAAGRGEALALLRSRVMWLIGGIQYVRYALVSAVATWLPSFIVYDRGHSLQTAGLVVAVGAVASAPANFLGGYISDRLHSPLLVIGGSLAVLSGTTFALARAGSFASIIVIATLTYLFLQLYFGPLFSLPIDLFGLRTAGLASGFSNLFANVGGFTFAYALGIVRDRTGSFSDGFYALSVLALVGVGCVVAVHAAQRRLQPVGTVV